MFCSKCGKQLHDDAVFCTYCGNPTSNSAEGRKPATIPVPQSVYAVQPHVKPYYPAQVTTMKIEPPNAPKLTKKEKNAVVTTGVIHIVSGIFTALILYFSGKVLFFSIEETAIIILLMILSAGVDVFLGVAALFKKRWAFLTIRILKIIDIILIFLGSLMSMMGGEAFTISLFDIIGIAFRAFIIAMASTCEKALSKDTQQYREKANRKQPSRSNAGTVLSSNKWICTKCGAHNSEGDSFCNDCGSYK